MVDVLGHIGFGLLCTVFVWGVWERQSSLFFIGFALLTTMLPDIDLYVPGLKHHGATHTILFVTIVALSGGVLLAPVARWLFRNWGQRDDTRRTHLWIVSFVAGGLFVGGLSHIIIDMFAAGGGGNPALEPFWPFFSAPISIKWIYYNAFVWNTGLFAVAVSSQLLLFGLTTVRAKMKYK